ncbi:outer membrane beta-barrel family protein [Chitinophaga sp. Cy-1792]|uniref:outer membrane beta-barrel family protein n=1 Tax=Chitinophaga sp. Cy-1792 TaxID=2608339 RepID=UPI001423C82D|nr:outer membrane beta-barrel family protein [Chitinophaga sp. Cy-1792]NIG57449.1 TonB-dependent receptor [Chitinophaga sp. Cy-1792]
MQRILLLVTMLMLALGVQAQPPAGAPRGGGMPGGMTGHLYGKVIDADGKPVPYVSVIILQPKLDSVTKKMKDVLLKGALTKANGEFSLDDIPMRPKLKMKISGTGYKAVERPVTFPPFDKDLGNIKLETDVAQLQGVTVAGTKPLMQLDVDKKVFNVEKNLTSAGGTAVDVMKNVPSVNVDIDGNVTVRNSSPQLYIDGRPTTLTLDQIPADAIESVEVITNPSAKYDASGGNAGILNLVLKKNRKTGYNGNLRAGVDKRGALNGGADFNLRQGKFNVSASAMGSQNKSVSTGFTDRNNFGDETPSFIHQDNYNKTKGGFLFGKLGVDYFMTNRTTVSVAGIKVHGAMKPNEVIGINTDSLFKTGTISNFSQRNSDSKFNFNANGLVLGMKHLFPKEGKELTVDVNYFGGSSTNNANYTTNYYTGKDITGTEAQRIDGGGKISFLTAQTDFVDPLTKTMKLETGLRWSRRTTDSHTNNFMYDATTGEYIPLPAASINYRNNDNVYAAYASISDNIGKFGYKVGVRMESSNYDGTIKNTGQKFSNNYPASLFPSLFLTQKLNNSQELQASYTRRINRPNFFQLIPYTDSTDRLNITKGNPGLVPEFTQSVELSYLKTFKGNSTFMATLYYKYTNNLITRYIQKEFNPVTNDSLLINTYINANNSYSAGAELTATTSITKWWNLAANVNIYNSKINTNAVGASQDALWSWFGKLNNNVKLPWALELQLSGTYQSKTNLPVNKDQRQDGPPMQQSMNASQGYIKAFYGVDAALKKSFLKNNAASITLAVNDIFRSRYSDQYSMSPYFNQLYSRLRDPQMFRATFAYRFGKMDVSLFKRKNMAAGMQGMSEVMQ